MQDKISLARLVADKATTWMLPSTDESDKVDPEVTFDYILGYLQTFLESVSRVNTAALMKALVWFARICEDEVELKEATTALMTVMENNRMLEFSAAVIEIFTSSFSEYIDAMQEKTGNGTYPVRVMFSQKK